MAGAGGGPVQGGSVQGSRGLGFEGAGSAGTPLASSGGQGAAPQAAAADPWAPTDDLRGPYLQVAKTFLLREVADGFEIIDQHALHERLTYELLLRDVQAGAVEVQRLLVPEVVEVSRADLARLEEHAADLGSLGIELAAFGETAVAVSGLPVRLRNPDPEGSSATSWRSSRGPASRRRPPTCSRRCSTAAPAGRRSWRATPSVRRRSSPCSSAPPRWRTTRPVLTRVPRACAHGLRPRAAFHRR